MRSVFRYLTNFDLCINAVYLHFRISLLVSTKKLGNQCTVMLHWLPTFLSGNLSFGLRFLFGRQSSGLITKQQAIERRSSFVSDT